MREVLRDLYGHQEWADALHWSALEAHGVSLQDAQIRERLHHIHLVQRAFLAIAQGSGLPSKMKLEDFPTMADMKAEARRSHGAARQLVEGLSDEQLAQPITIPWFKDPPLALSLGQALHQAAMHSHYHRGQNAARLKELGGTPPLTDLIAWYWKGRPAPQWP